jgi:nicotinamide mononucleotide transporter
MDFISIHNILFTILGYQVSWIELIGVITGLMSVVYAVRANILTWPVSILNAVAFFILFYQVNLYSDMFLQVYFFVISIIGWMTWKRKSNKNEIAIMCWIERLFVMILLIVCFIIVGFFISNIHIILPKYFVQPAAYPFLDSFVLVASIIAVTLMAMKRLESWILWIIIDCVCVFLYLAKGVLFMSIEYAIFLGLAISGLISWIKFYTNGKRISNR